MTKEEMIAEFIKLSPEDREEVWEALLKLEGLDGPTPEEAALLDKEFAEYERDGDRGRPWKESLLICKRFQREQAELILR